MFDVKSWGQWPDTTPEGMSIRVDSSDSKRRAIADDFECRMPGQLTHVRLWGSWKDDRRGVIAKIRLRIHPDDPIGAIGTDKTNRFSKPGPEILWEKEYIAGQFEETSYHAGDYRRPVVAGRGLLRIGRGPQQPDLADRYRR